MVVVRRGKNESPEAVWRRFGKTNYEENLMEELRNRRYHKKPSIIKKELEKQRVSHKKRRRSMR